MVLILVKDEFRLGKAPEERMSFVLSRVSFTLKGLGLGVLLPLYSPSLALITLIDLLREGGRSFVLSN